VGAIAILNSSGSGSNQLEKGYFLFQKRTAMGGRMFFPNKNKRMKNESIDIFPQEWREWRKE